MARLLDVEREAFRTRPGRVLTGGADVDEPALDLVPSPRHDPVGERPREVGPIRRLERLRRERVLRVGQHQFLMLLLVLKPELDALRIGVAAMVRPRDAIVDLGAIRVHLAQRRPRHPAAPRAIDARADRVVVAVPQIRRARVERLAGEHELLEEPRRVREVPLRRARVGHRLELRVLGGERCAQAQRAGTHGLESFCCARGRMRWRPPRRAVHLACRKCGSVERTHA